MKVKYSMIIVSILLSLFLLVGCTDSSYKYTEEDLEAAKTEGYNAGVEDCYEYIHQYADSSNLYDILYEKGAYIDNASLHIVWDDDGHVTKDFDVLVDIVADLFDNVSEGLPEEK